MPACDHYAGSEKLMRKSLSLQQELGPIFDVTLDCEDGASAGNEAAHAQLIAALAASKENCFGRVGARVHDLGSKFFEQDVDIICKGAAQRLAYLMVPKVESACEAAKACEFIQACAKKNGREHLPVHFLIETHGALAEVRQIAALPQAESLSFGIMDFVSAHYGAISADAMRSPGQFEHPLVVRAKLEISAACHAYGKVPSHSVTTDFSDPQAAGNDARRAASEFGYTRMWSIHPNQIKAVVTALSPSSEEVTEAEEILSKAQDCDWAPISYNRILHDRASYRYYWTVLKRAKANGFALSERASSWL
ncbi:MAG: CoA ester lyase [Paucimonas sp.]|nr:CoA ester lyase [Paucimonas sp.]